MLRPVHAPLFLACILFSTNIFAQEFYDDPAGVRTFQNSRIGNSLLSPSTDYARLIKNDDEVDNYISCYMSQVIPNQQRAAARIQEFNTKYRPFIKQAVQAFQIPYALAACVMFRETFFDNNAVSHSGAKTIAQFTGDTYETLKTHMSRTTKLMPSYNEFLKMQENNEDILNSRSKNFFVKCHQFSQGDGPHYREATLPERGNGMRLCRNQLRDFHINRKLMDELQVFIMNSSRGMKGDQRRLYFKAPQGQWPTGSDMLPPSSFAKLKERPMWLAAMNMFYLKRMTMIADSHFNPEGFKKSNDYLGYLAVIAGSYNRGPGALNSIVSKPNGSIKRWCDNLKGSTEARNYMLSVKRCIAKGSNYALTGSGFNSSLCHSPSPGVSNITDPCDTLLAPGDGKVYDLRDPNEPVICDPAKGEDCSEYTEQ